MTALHLLISGRVQGVWFRESTRQEAERLGVEGWVQNLPDGRVEAWLQGDESAVAALHDWCRHGPDGARVDAMEALAVADEAGLSGFQVRR